MANLLKMADVQSIITLHARGWSGRKIARELGIDRETVGRHLALAADPKPASAPAGIPEPTGSKPATAPAGIPVASDSKPATALVRIFDQKDGSIVPSSPEQSPTLSDAAPQSASRCEPWRQLAGGGSVGAFESAAMTSASGEWNSAGAWAASLGNAVFSTSNSPNNIAQPTTFQGLNASRDLIQGQGPYVLRDAETGQVFKIGSARDFDARFQEYRAIEAQTGRQLAVDLYYQQLNGNFNLETTLRRLYEGTGNTLFWDGTGARANGMGFAPGEFNLAKLIAQDPNFGKLGWALPIR